MLMCSLLTSDCDLWPAKNECLYIHKYWPCVIYSRTACYFNRTWHNSWIINSKGLSCDPIVKVISFLCFNMIFTSILDFLFMFCIRPQNAANHIKSGIVNCQMLTYACRATLNRKSNFVLKKQMRGQKQADFYS